MGIDLCEMKAPLDLLTFLLGFSDNKIMLDLYTNQPKVITQKRIKVGKRECIKL